LSGRDEYEPSPLYASLMRKTMRSPCVAYSFSVSAMLASVLGMLVRKLRRQPSGGVRHYVCRTKERPRARREKTPIRTDAVPEKFCGAVYRTVVFPTRSVSLGRREGGPSAASIQ
jgi:hypothetical protein